MKDKIEDKIEDVKDKVEEMVDEAKPFFEKYKVYIIGAVVVLVLVVGAALLI